MIIPAPFTFVLLTLLTATGVLVAIWPDWSWLWLGIAAGSVTASLIDVVMLLFFRAPLVERELPAALPLYGWRTVRLTLRNQMQRRLHIKLFDHLPAACEYTNLPQRAWLNSTCVVPYEIRALQRGLFTWDPCTLLVDSTLRLWRRRFRAAPVQHVKVFPDYAPVIEYAMLAMQNQLSMMGILKHRRRGTGTDFHQLREYREDDSLRQIDWKATSRVHKYIVREYQAERDQNILFLLDCGHRMLSKDGILSHFDHTLNAVLLLSYVCLRQGDAVGLLTFSGEKRWQPPRKSRSHLQSLLHAIYDIQPGYAVPDYAEAALTLMRRQRKRAMVILISNLREDDRDDLLQAVHLLSTHHLVVVVSLREQGIEEPLHRADLSFDEALTTAVLHDYVWQRRQLLIQLQAEGVYTLDVAPRQLPVALVNRYLDIKANAGI